MTGVFRAESADIFDIIGLEQDAFSSPWDEESLGEAFSHEYDRFFIARDEGEALGYVLLRLLEPAEILRLAVAYASRRQGVGSALIAKAIDEARTEGAGSILLELRADNAAALRLYTRAGFRVISSRRGYYHHPDCDALIMRYIC